MDVNEKIQMFREKLLKAAGKCADYSRYYEMLLCVEEQYDETLELYNYDIWLGRSEETMRGKAAKMLKITSELFLDMCRNSEQELYHVLREICQQEKEVQRAVLGMELDAEQLTEDNFEEMILEWEDHPYVQEEALQSFLQNIKEVWGTI